MPTVKKLKDATTYSSGFAEFSSNIFFSSSSTLGPLANTNSTIRATFADNASTAKAA
jgi:hypothetical protein